MMKKTICISIEEKYLKLIDEQAKERGLSRSVSINLIFERNFLGDKGKPIELASVNEPAITRPVGRPKKEVPHVPTPEELKAEKRAREEEEDRERERKWQEERDEECRTKNLKQLPNKELVPQAALPEDYKLFNCRGDPNSAINETEWHRRVAERAAASIADDMIPEDVVVNPDADLYDEEGNFKNKACEQEHAKRLLARIEQWGKEDMMAAEAFREEQARNHAPKQTQEEVNNG